MEKKQYKTVQSGNVRIDLNKMPDAPYNSFMEGCMKFVEEYLNTHGGEEGVRKEMQES